MNKYKYPILALIASLLAVSCSTTKYVPDGSYLLSKVSIRVDSLTAYEQEQLGELEPYLIAAARRLAVQDAPNCYAGTVYRAAVCTR